MKVSPRERKLLGFLGLVAVLGAFRLLWLAASAPPPPALVESVAAQSPSRGGRSARAVAPPTSVVLLRTDRLDAVPDGFEVGRDLFRFAAPPPPPPPPPPTRAELDRMRQEAEVRRQRAEAAAIENAKPRPPAVTLHFLGSFGHKGARIAVFTDAAGQNVWNARVGDVLDGKFMVDKIGFESVDLKFVGFESVPPARLAAGE